MFYSISRRAALGGAALLVPFVARAAEVAPWRMLDDLEKQSGTRIGVMAIDTGNGNALFYRENERFLMCSSFKLSLAAAVLARADAGQEKLDRLVSYAKADLLDASPATTKNLGSGMRVDALCEAAVIDSDNTAANLLLAGIGGPAALTKFWRSLGDQTSRLDRAEPALNLVDGEKDTTTPVAMAGNLRAILLGDTLSPSSRQRLNGWLAASTTGQARLRAGLPKDWTVGDKTGTGTDTMVDLAIITPPGRKPILVAAYVNGGNGATTEREKIFPQIAGIVAGTVTPASRPA